MIRRGASQDGPASARRRALRRSILRPVGTTTVLLLAYFLLPFTRLDRPRTVLLLIAGALTVGAVCAWQVRRVLRAEYPIAQAVEGFAAVFGSYLVGFATVYHALANHDPGNFSESLTRLDALYFCVTVFATVGFGDITAVTQPARAVVLVQMIGNLVLIGTALRLFTTSVTLRRNRLRQHESGAGGDPFRTGSPPTAPR
ncbi:potassium channel family protein [Nocardia sp. NPDC127526]|uniref:potassium channel family protein n=1 Tax=Nocardia sp. NPDC127526 TaxID=3345393 RepID=UPI0036338506